VVALTMLGVNRSSCKDFSTILEEIFKLFLIDIFSDIEKNACVLFGELTLLNLHALLVIICTPLFVIGVLADADIMAVSQGTMVIYKCHKSIKHFSRSKYGHEGRCENLSIPFNVVNKSLLCLNRK